MRRKLYVLVLLAMMLPALVCCAHGGSGEGSGGQATVTVKPKVLK